MEFTNAVTIKRELPDVFAFLENFENIPKWNYAIHETKKVSTGPVQAGTRYEQTRTLPQHATETFELIEHKTNSTLAIRGDIGPFFGVLRYEFSTTPDGTLLTNVARLEARGLGGALRKLAGASVRDAVATNLDKLRQILEA